MLSNFAIAKELTYTHEVRPRLIQRKRMESVFNVLPEFFVWEAEDGSHSLGVKGQLLWQAQTSDSVEDTDTPEDYILRQHKQHRISIDLTLRRTSPDQSLLSSFLGSRGGSMEQAPHPTWRFLTES